MRNRKPGRPIHYARTVLMNRFGVTKRQIGTMTNQLTRCKDNAAIRLLLGVSR